jgi:hypothetical protein
MKNFLNKFLLGVAALFAVAACTTDPTEDLKPSFSSLTLNGKALSDTTTFVLEPAKQYEVGFTVDKGAEEVIDLAVSFGEEIVETLLLDDEVNPYSGTATFTTPDVADEYTLSFTVKGSDGIVILDENFTVEVRSLEPTVNVYEAKLLYAPEEDSTGASFYSSSLNKTYSFKDVVSTEETLSPEIDFGYRYGETEKATLASIFEYDNSYDIYDFSDWVKKNKTTFRATTLSVDAFDAITEFDDEKIAEEFEAGTDEGGIVTDIQTGQVIAFQTKVDDAEVEGTFGLIKIVEIKGTYAANDYMKIEVKVIK